MTHTPDLPPRHELDEAWLRVEAVLHSRRTSARHRLAWIDVAEDRTCSRD